MENVEERHDISDAHWALIAPLLPGQRGQWGGIAKDNRKFINGVFWILRTGAPWRDLPSRYGKWGTVYQRFRRWYKSERWEKILEALSQNTDFEWLMIEDEPLQGSSARGRGKGRQPDHEPHKRGLNTKIHLAVDAKGRPVRMLITEGTRADCKEAIHLIEGISAEGLMADRGYDTNEIIAYAVSNGMKVVIPT